jgi:6-bladed beta-propeller
MRQTILILITVTLLFSCVCSTGKSASSNNSIDFNSLKVIKKEYAGLNELGKITKVIKLETSKDSLLGRIGRVRVDKTNGDLVIGDFRNTNQVLRFNKKGEFICKYGRKGQGPGEYVEVYNFTLTNKGDVILLTRLKLIKFSKNGTFLQESRTNVYAAYIECQNDLIYVSVLRYDRKPKEKKAILVFNSFLKNIGGIGEYDTRLEKNLLVVKNSLAKIDGSLFFIDTYDICLNIYNTQTKNLSRLSVPNNNSSLDNIWKKKQFTLKEDQELDNHLHRFENILSIDERILLIEYNNDKNKYHVWLLNLEKREVLIFKWSSLFGSSREKVKTDLYINRIPGSYKNGIIGVLDNVEEFNLHKAKYPILKDIEFKADDNPILVFFEFSI